MKKWKKLLACLLAGLIALAVFTACDASVGVPIGSKHVDANSAKTLCDKFGVTYDEELSNKAYTIANWVVSSSVSCKVNPEKTELYRKDNISNEAKAQMKIKRYATAFDIMGIGKGVGGGMAADDFTPGFGIDCNLEANGTSDITFVLPNDSIVTDTMKSAAAGKTKLGVAYVVKDGVHYAVVLFG